MNRFNEVIYSIRNMIVENLERKLYITVNIF